MPAHRFHRARIASVLLASLVSLDRSASADAPVSAQAVQDCTNKAIKYLYSLEKDGTWDPPARHPNVHGDTNPWTQEFTNWGGSTAVITYALLTAGEDPNDPRIKSAIEFLKTADLKGTYSLGMRSQVWAHLPLNAQTRMLIQRDAELLHEEMITKGRYRGLWWYSGQGADQNNFDYSNSQYGVLGMWGAADVGLEIPGEIWSMMDKAWRDGQQPTGGWSYKRIDDPTQEFTVPRFTMTAAGIATLYLTDDYLAPGAGISCDESFHDPNVEKGLDWLGDHFDDLMKADNIVVGAFNYGLYGLERVGVASGRKYIGKTDWFQFGANQLIKNQGPEGGWRTDQGPFIASTTTALGLLFLAYGGAPVAINKLAWEQPASPDAAESERATWNQRPRDVANFVHWMEKQTEASLKWQVINLRAPSQDIHDAPVLYISGSQTLQFSPDDMAKLRQYVEEGGLILGSANCGGAGFSDSFRKLGQKLFPLYEFRELPANHIIYTGEQYQRTKWRNKPSVLGLSNGVRELMLLLPNGDVGRWWQLKGSESRPEAFDVGDDIVLYASDQEVLHRVNDSYLVVPNASLKPAQTIKLARLEYPGNWNPEPGGWRRLASVIHNAGQIELHAEPVQLGEGKLDAAVYKIAHLTGTTRMVLTAAQVAELKRFVDGGGTVIIDAAGGSTAFAGSAEQLISQITPAGSSLALLDPSQPSMAGIDPKIRRFAAVRMGKAARVLPRGVAINGRVVVFFSPLDLSAGLVGQPIDGITGYVPETATSIVSGIVSYAAHH
jgi:hypothetical protein